MDFCWAAFHEQLYSVFVAIFCIYLSDSSRSSSSSSLLSSSLFTPCLSSLTFHLSCHNDEVNDTNVLNIKSLAFFLFLFLSHIFSLIIYSPLSPNQWKMIPSSFLPTPLPSISQCLFLWVLTSCCSLVQMWIVASEMHHLHPPLPPTHPATQPPRQQNWNCSNSWNYADGLRLHSSRPSFIGNLNNRIPKFSSLCTFFFSFPCFYCKRAVCDGKISMKNLLPFHFLLSVMENIPAYVGYLAVSYCFSQILPHLHSSFLWSPPPYTLIIFLALSLSSSEAWPSTLFSAAQ